ncbi:hypothetical protein LZG74_20035 [Dyadobacter sp. CY327]|uniref:hypothetical protein n=1 Tax=Dyadobacter sp. CY327 TaxID=2907301 RepID=UPI001F3C0221|nr:hypothetical protein [Dyadobacter sp. CY327]MCE7072614.1 hypothetical protein [Dyadobacter sp. CY327]
MRPRVQIIDPDPEAYKNFENVTGIIALSIGNRDASQLKMVPAPNQKFFFYKPNHQEFKYWYIDHAPVGESVTFAYDYDFMDLDPIKSVSATAELVLTFVDENGYSYQQSIQAGIKDGRAQIAVLLDVIYINT